MDNIGSPPEPNEHTIRDVVHTITVTVRVTKATTLADLTQSEEEAAAELEALLRPTYGDGITWVSHKVEVVH